VKNLNGDKTDETWKVLPAEARIPARGNQQYRYLQKQVNIASEYLRGDSHENTNM
jgi:hypothetical protein